MSQPVKEIKIILSWNELSRASFGINAPGRFQVGPESSQKTPENLTVCVCVCVYVCVCVCLCVCVCVRRLGGLLDRRSERREPEQEDQGEEGALYQTHQRCESQVCTCVCVCVCTCVCVCVCACVCV